MTRTKQNMQTLIPWFYDKVVVITGGSSELGHALSYWYLNHGAKVAMVGRNIKKIEEFGRNYKEYKNRWLGIVVDF